MDIALKLQYDGTNYSGWQIQPNAITVQELLDKALLQVFGVKLSSLGSGRTDTGVHARAQVCSVKYEGIPKLPAKKLVKALNQKLPLDIRIIDAAYLAKFHARYDAIFREYSYSIITKEDVFNNRFCSYVKYPIDFDLLFQSAIIFKQKVDFTTFSKLNPDTINPICNVILSQWEQIDTHHYKYSIRSNHFLYGMVRSIVGTMIDIARSKRTIEEVGVALYSKNRQLNSPLISPKGLVLEKIYYPTELNF